MCYYNYSKNNLNTTIDSVSVAGRVFFNCWVKNWKVEGSKLLKKD